MRTRLAAAISVVVASAACGAGCKPKEAPPSAVFIRVLDEAKMPVEGAEIVSHSAVIAQTDADGRAEVSVSGTEGATFMLDVRCPTNYRSPSASLSIRRLSTGETAPEYVSRCSKLRHTLVVVVRAEGGPNLPVIHLGKEVARTDESGSAHVLVEGDVRERVELQLATNDPQYARVHPQNPIAAFEVAEWDDVKVFDVTFKSDPKPVIRGPVRTGPRAF